MCLLTAVKGGIKSETIPDISKFATSSKLNVGQQGIVSFAQGNTFSAYAFKEGKTQTIDMVTIFKQEKGINAFKKLQAGPASTGKAKVIGGAKLKRGSKVGSTSKSGDVKKIAERISKFTPGGQSSAAKRSAQRILTGKTPILPSPGAGSQAGTTNH